MSSSAIPTNSNTLKNRRGIEDLPECDCEQLVGRLRAICRGETELPLFGEGNTVEAFRRLWSGQLPVKCVHRGEVIRVGKCDLCGFDKGHPFDVLACALHGECSLLRKHSKVKGCAACEDYQPQPQPVE